MTITFKKLIIVSGFLLFITGCELFNDDDSPHIPGPASCSDESYNQYIYDTMKQFYYWYDQVDPTNQINPRDTIAYPTPQSLIDKLKNAQLDRFSGVSDAASFSQFYGDGIFLGVGLRLIRDELTNDLLVSYAHDDGSAYAAGIRRGDKLITINNYAAKNLTGEDWTIAWGENAVGNLVALQGERPDGTPIDVTIEKSLVNINTTQYSTTFDSAGKKIGYLHFTNFLGNTAVANLNNKFLTFKNNNIAELIVDLRYNGGGKVSTANHLASLIGGSKTVGSIFTRLLFNDNPGGYNGYQETINFNTPTDQTNHLTDLNRVFFITTGSSCSASELVINSLIPNTNIDVIIVGSTTCGKPMGSQPQSHCNKSLSAINFVLQNSDNQGDYFNGIDSGYNGLTAFCDASDDIYTPLGNSSESSIAEAISYINTGICTNTLKAKPVSRFKPVAKSKDQTDVLLNELF